MSIERLVLSLHHVMLLGIVGCVIFFFGIIGWGYLAGGWPQLDEANPSPIPYLTLIILFSFFLDFSSKRKVIFAFLLMPVFFGLLYLVPDGRRFKVIDPSVRADGQTYIFTPEQTATYSFCLFLSEDQHKNLITKYKSFYAVLGQIEVVDKNSNAVVLRTIVPIEKDHQLELDQKEAPPGLGPGPLTMAFLISERLKKGVSYEIKAVLGQNEIDSADGKTKTVGPAFSWVAVPAPRLTMAYDWSPGGLVKIKWPAALSNKGWLTISLFFIYAAFVQIVFSLPKFYSKFSAIIKRARSPRTSGHPPE